MDFFTVPTVTFRVLYCFFVIQHQRRKILHCNVTPRPTAEWIVQQLREAFPEPCRYQYVILDRDRKFDAEVVAFLTAAGLEAKRTSVRSPWQNGLAERWIESEGHAERTHRRATAGRKCKGGVDNAARWSASSLHLGPGGVIEDTLASLHRRSGGPEQTGSGRPSDSGDLCLRESCSGERRARQGSSLAPNDVN